MPTEYHIQKRGLAIWQYVTWYETYEEAKKNFDKLVKGFGYSYRIVEQKVMDEVILHGEYKDTPGDDVEEDSKPVATGGWTKSNQQTAWGSVSGNVLIDPQPSHGMVGKVWLGNPTTKEKKRVEPALVAGMMAEGWVKAGPRTVL